MANAVVPVSAFSSGGVPGGGAWSAYKVFSNELVNGNVDVDSVFSSGGALGILLGEFSTFGVYLKLTGTGPDITLKTLQSFQDAQADYAVPDVNGTIITVTDTNIHQVAAALTPMPYLRFRLQGNAGNGTDVRATMYIWMRTS